LKSTDKKKFDKCPKDYVKWACVVAGMVFAFVAYLVYLNVTNAVSITIIDELPSGVITQVAGDVVLTEHINEEDDYEKPVCKRLEESGERYDVEETF